MQLKAKKKKKEKRKPPFLAQEATEKRTKRMVAKARVHEGRNRTVRRTMKGKGAPEWVLDPVSRLEPPR